MNRGRQGARRRSRLAIDLTVLGVVGVLLLLAFAAGGVSLYNQFYGPSAFVQRYVDLLAEGRAADALRVPGVALDRTALDTADMDQTPSEALLRRAALAPISDAAVVGETVDDDGVTQVTVEYTAGHASGRSRFAVIQDGWTGVVPNWRFATSPLAEIELTLRGADQFAVNGFPIDRRQVSALGADASPLDPLPMLVFTPGLYSVTVDTAISTSAGVSVLADTPLASTPVDVQTLPTAKFTEVVQQRVEEFLTGCTEQQVLQPTECPFGLEVQNRIDGVPVWSIAEQPTVAIVPDGPNWAIPTADAVAHIEVDIRSLFDGSIQHVAEDIPFQVNGTITIRADGAASIRVGSPELDVE